MSRKKYWFKRRRYGWGWMPATWQGWSVLAIFALVVIGGALTLSDTPEGEFTTEVGVYLLVVFLSVSGLLQISYRKGPNPKWRWGETPGDNPEEDF